MNSLLAINIGDYLTSNARESFLAAASRWGADYVEVSFNHSPELLPCFLKAETILRLAHYEQVAYFDADMLIRSDAPNCFELFKDRNKMYAVGDMVENREGSDPRLAYDIIGSVRMPYFSPLQSKLGLDVSVDKYIENFVNSGFLICSPEHCRELLSFVRSNLPEGGSPYSSNGHYEQALLNYAIQALCPESLEFVDETWNYINPILSPNSMNAYVYHFTGANHRILKPAIGTFQWTVSSP